MFSDTDELKLVLPAEKFVGLSRNGAPEHSYMYAANDINVVNLNQVHTQKPQGGGEWPLTDQHSMQEKLQYLLYGTPDKEFSINDPLKFTLFYHNCLHK